MFLPTALKRSPSLALLLLTGLLAACGGGSDNGGPVVVPPVVVPPVVTPPTTFTPVKINFQPQGSAVPTGFTADTGAAYTAASGSGWVTQASAGTAAVPLDLSANTRVRANGAVGAQLNTFIHMQYPATGTTGTSTPGAWEYALPSGTYTVTVVMGDAADNFDSRHSINIEGKVAVSSFVPTANRRFYTSTLRVPVTDGRLTIDAVGGENTKLDSVSIDTAERPSVRVTSPQDAEQMFSPTKSLTADVNVVDSAIDLASLAAGVQLTEHISGTKVAAQVNTSGGGDVVVLQPNAPLKPNTQYDFAVTDALKDTSGLKFLPSTRTFVTGSATTAGSGLSFEQVALDSAPKDNAYTTVEIGPDHRLYAATLMGKILRFNILPDGTLGTFQTINSVTDANGGPRTIIGLKFDPASTADNLIVWITNNYFWDGSSPAQDWSGKITRLSGPDLGNVQDYVVGLPRSVRDHMTNGLAFKPGEPSNLYITQGSMSAMGAPDPAWRNVPEHLLNAAVLKLDLSKLSAANFPLNVKTEAGGSYSPYAAGAPLTIFASGVRNAYRLVWHSNGSLYAPTNGSAAGGNTPGTPADLNNSPACKNRSDGPYTAPVVPALFSASVQNDYLFRVVQGGYYGHPNPLRCEWVMNGGNPTTGADSAEVFDYPVGTLPDRNYRGFAYDFGEHASPNGVIEEYTLAGNSALKNKLMVVRYSAGKDIVILTPGKNGDIELAPTAVSGLGNFNPSPLDLSEDRSNGNLYVAQLDETTGGGKLTLVRPK